MEDDGVYSETQADGSKTVLKPAKITLNDCLACRRDNERQNAANYFCFVVNVVFKIAFNSGCITSAESVLITQQSVAELLNVLNENSSRPEGVPTCEEKKVATR